MHAHIKQTKTIMEYFKRCDKMHSGDAAGGTSNGGPANGDHAAVAAAVAADDSDVPLTVTRPSNAPAQYRSSRRAAANAAAAAAAAATGAAFSSSDSAAPFKPYR